jgi:hypothetical protein
VLCASHNRPRALIVGYFDRARRNSQKKPTKNIAAVKSQSKGFAKKPEFQPIGPVPKWYAADRYALMTPSTKRDATHTHTSPATTLLM